jgi:hypothetical protein
VIDQIQAQRDRLGTGTLEDLLYGGETWRVGEDGVVVS